MDSTRRLNHIFRPDGRSLIFAFDHAMIFGPGKGLERPREMLAQVVAGGADAILTSYGVATRFTREISALGLILRIDGGGTTLGANGPHAQIFRIEDALRLDADAVAVCAYPGTAQEETSLRTLAHVVSSAHTWNLPIMAEMVPGGFDCGPEFRTAESIAISARVAAELGADWVKVPYAAGFERVAETCYVPAVILGGAKMGNELGMLETIRTALDAGAVGVAIGRNIFQAEHPATMTAAIASLIHDDASVDEALAILHARSL